MNGAVPKRVHIGDWLDFVWDTHMSLLNLGGFIPRLILRLRSVTINRIECG